MKSIQLKSLGFLFLIVSQYGHSQSKKETVATKPNVLFIAIDDMNNWASAMGGVAKTPNMEKLAKAGKLFTNAYCVVPACNPSRVAIMTGVRPETSGQYTNPGNFRDLPGNANRITLPLYLQQNGYEAIAAGKIFHNGRGKGTEPDPQSDPQSWNYQFPNDVGTKGHQLYLDKNNQAKWLEGAMYIEGMDSRKPEYLSKFGVWGVTPEKKEETADWKNAEFASNYLGEKHDKPFFLAVGLFRPHSPQIAPQEFFDMYPLESIQVPELPENDMDDIPEIAKTNFSSKFVELVKEKGQLQKATQGYLASMSFADACIGKILEGVENGPNKDNTIIVLWTDHGWQLAQKERWEKFSLWKQSTNSPLIIKYPNMKNPGESTNQAVSLLDLFPTVLDLSGIEKPDFLEGTSLVPLLTDANYKRKEPAITTYEKGNISVEKNDWNFIQYKDGSEELYNHATDPKEFKNVIKVKENQAIIKELRAYVTKLKNK
ncbi:sulfatase [Flavobacterium nackdongense]|uniref:Iduronate-2-sulfatase n=1 Tax=Flavobacterium nackdongense TaxID=2547394 RepID=A0A4P6YBM9_9FLAO|nr:sulfatase [Flavobacterium nackdongense]QBN20479.1 iduronate-2-sulfatase [Flavobacterium nackdongense]